MENRKRKLDKSPDIIEIDAKKKDQNSNEDTEDDIIELKDENDVVEKKAKSSRSDRPPCVYGSNCYRTNPLHLAEYSHPSKEESSIDLFKETV
jgi:hypothetical protein